MQFEMLTFGCPGPELPPTPHQPSGGIVYTSNRRHGKQKAVTVQCNARKCYESPCIQTTDGTVKKFSRASLGLIATSRLYMHCLRQCPYHSKIARAGAHQKLYVAIVFLEGEASLSSDKRFELN